ncbi:MAG TPA: hypothetical protein VM734_32290 [Kofleriaceae bacterium]|nr:hypothetical protein [Kofleriaceae bacterium]
MSQPPVRPAALEALVAAAAGDQRPLPRQRPSAARRLTKIAALAQDQDDNGGALGLLWLGLLIAGAILGPLWLMRGPAWLGVLACVGLVAALMVFHRRGERIQQDRERRLADALGGRPFPIDGLVDWLTADRPLADVYLGAPVAADVLEPAVRVVDPRAELSWITPTHVRVALAPRRLRAARRHAPELLGGDLDLLRGLVDRVLVPIHPEVMIVRLDLGGEVVGDAAGPA